MTRRSKVLSVVLILVAVIVSSLAWLISHDSRCGTAPALSANAQRMKAIVHRCYGSPDVVRLEEIAKPTPEDDRVLVRVRAASVNPLDWHFMRGDPYIVRLDSGLGAPQDPRIGTDFAGTVEAVGKSVTRFKPGDEVFGARDGAFAEYVSVRENGALALKPANLTFEQAAAVPVAAITALQALRDQGKIQPGQKVLINGASGGVGTFAVQIAKSYGADVTGVTSTRNVGLVRSLGADRVIDYTREDFTNGPQRYDVILDLVGNRPLLDIRHVLQPNGIYMGIGGGGPSDGGFIGPLAGVIKELVVSRFVSQKFMFFEADLTKEDMAVLSDLMQAGKVTPVIDRRYRLSETGEAIRYLEQGHARGKVVITVE
jgi:NADPH:quinone reductase-like Zn-dependent oxidoreductase